MSAHAKSPTLAPITTVDAPRFFDLSTADNVNRWNVLALAAFVDAMQGLGRVVVVRREGAMLRFASIAKVEP